VQYYSGHCTDAEGFVLRSYESLVKHEGNSALFAAIEISIVSTLAGRPVHVHAEGVRGTGKTTIMRAAAGILPMIERITGCDHNCRPWAPHCPDHVSAPPARLREIGSEFVQMPFLEISHSARLGTVVGSIDLARVVDPSNPQAALLLGTIPRANRGIIFIDEINRLADTSPELTDVLLDTMGTKPGRVQIEEAGLPVVSLPLETGVWAASNPDEDPGPLEDVRRQLSDRFDLSVEMGRACEPGMIRRILECDDFDVPRRAPEAPTAGCWPGRMAAAALLAPRVLFPDEMVELLATIYVDFDIESIRALEAARTAARCRAALAGRSRVSIEDLRAVLGMVLRHRVEVAALANILRYVDAMQEKSAHGRSVGAVMPGCPGGPGRAGTQGAEGTRPDRDGGPDRADNDCACDRGRSGDGGHVDMDQASAHGGAGLRGILHRLFEHMRSEQHGGSCGPECAGRLDSQGPSGSRGDSAGGPDGGYAGGVGTGIGACGRRRQGAGTGAGAGAGAGTGSACAPESTVSEVCPPSIARPITQVGPKVVFAEEDLI
jgi:magnesium chelatase subunit I